MQTLTASRCRERLIALRSAERIGVLGRTTAQRAITASHHVGHSRPFSHSRRLTISQTATEHFTIQHEAAADCSRLTSLESSRHTIRTGRKETSRSVKSSGNFEEEVLRESYRAAKTSGEKKEVQAQANEVQSSVVLDHSPTLDSNEAHSRIQFLRQVADDIDISNGPKNAGSLQDGGAKADGHLHRPRRILAEYIRNILIPRAAGHDTGSNEASLQSAYAKQALPVQYGWEDIANWADVVASTSSETAATKLLQLAESTSDPKLLQRNKAPVFLLTVLLRRRNLSTRAFKILLLQTWNMLANVYDAPRVKDVFKSPSLDRIRLPSYATRGKGNYGNVGLTTAATLHWHLLRHARRHWPEVIPRVIDAFISLCKGLDPQQDLSPSHARKLTDVLNKTLQVVSRPSKNEPFQNINLAQKAQMQLLNHISQFEPALPVTRTGYRAVVSVQLRQPKTSREQDWASLQSKSWPPWKEDKYGLDADKGVEYGTSRARQALIRAVEDGYAPQEWEQATGILAGWDTDNSPTIQTRSAPPSLKSSEVEMLDDYEVSQGKDTRDGPLVWAARIQATRTLDEAWACFQSYNSRASEWALLVWFEMYKKLVYARVGARASRASEDGVDATFVGAQVSPGDSLRVWKTSENPRERPFLREPIPNEYAFVKDAIRRGLRLTPHTLIFALRYAENLTTGFQFLQLSTLDSQAIAILRGQHKVSSDILQQQVTPMIVTNLVQLICRSVNTHSWHAPAMELSQEDAPYTVQIPENILHHAYSLLLACRITDGMTWFLLLGIAVKNVDLAQMNSRLREFQHIGRSQRSQRARNGSRLLPLTEFLLIAVSKDISINFRELLFLCQQLQRPLESVNRPLDNSAQNIEDLQKHISLMKVLFRDITTGEGGKTLAMHLKSDPSNVSLFEDPSVISHGEAAVTNRESADEEAEDVHELPRLVNTPRPVHLHGFMRLLGLSDSPNDVVDLLKWMSYFAPELAAKIQGHRNANAQLRRTFICARLILENWNSSTHSSSPGATQSSALDEARQIIESHGEWGGWPSDEECEDYQQYGGQAYDSSIHSDEAPASRVV